MRTPFPLLALAILFQFGAATLIADDGSPATAAPENDDETNRDTKFLAYKLAYNPPTDNKEGEFVVTLTNTSKRDLNVTVNPKLLESTLEVTAPAGVRYALITKEYQSQYSHGLSLPNKLGAGKSFQWRLPLSSLLLTFACDRTDNSIRIHIPESMDISDDYHVPPTPESLVGCKVITSLSVGVSKDENDWLPDYRGISTSNAVEIPELIKR